MNRKSLESDILQDVARSLETSADKLPASLSDNQLDKYFCQADGTTSVRRTHGRPLPESYKIGRSRRTPLSVLVNFVIDQINDERAAA